MPVCPVCLSACRLRDWSLGVTRVDKAVERRQRFLAALARRSLLADNTPVSFSETLDADGSACARTGDSRSVDTRPGKGISTGVGVSHGVLSAVNEPLTKWDKPAWREVPAVGEPGAPEALAAASARQTRLVELAYAVPQTGDDACAAWVEAIWARLGMGVITGHARDLYERYCTNSNLAELKVGMIVAVPEVPYSAGGVRHGHVGLYAGDDMVMDCAASRVRRVPLDLWLSAYGVMYEPRWGWLALIDLSR